MCVLICAAGIVSAGDEDEAEGPVEEAHGEVQRRGGARLRRSGQVRGLVLHGALTETFYTAVCLLVEKPEHDFSIPVKMS